MQPLRRRFLCLAVCIAMALLPQSVSAGEVVVFAAASLAEAMEEVAEDFADATGHKAILSFAGSSVLARQIQQGAPADIFISANADWMDVLEKDGLIDPESRVDLLRNTLVLVAHGKDAPSVEIRPGMDLAGVLGNNRLAMALVDAVPAGIYGRLALESLGVWDDMAPKVVQADNVRAALALVSIGEAPMGIVYRTDALADINVSIVGAFPADTHPPIVYPAAMIAASKNPLKESFLDYLKGPAARATFERRGFGVTAD